MRNWIFLGMGVFVANSSGVDLFIDLLEREFIKRWRPYNLHFNVRLNKVSPFITSKSVEISFPSSLYELIVQDIYFVFSFV